MLLLLIALLVGWGIWKIARHDAEVAQRFMAECEQHEPHYKCESMWRAGESHTVVLPVVVGR